MTLRRKCSGRTLIRHDRRRTPGLVALAAVAATGHLLYPLAIGAAVLVRRPRPAPSPRDWPGVTAVVAAYRERDTIAGKVRGLLENGYPGPLDVVVVADDAATAAAARATPATVIAPPERLGKAEALNRGVAAAGRPIVVLSDANTRLEPGTLATLVRWFEDPDVGAVAGEKRVDGAGEGLYWRFESWLKRCESRRGSTIGLVGELAAVRRALYRPLPADVIVDDLWIALDVIAAGKRIPYEPAAIALEDPSPTWRDEWERRTRVVCGVLDVLWRRRELLRPGRSPVWLELWGHRLVRSSFGPVAHVALLLVALRALPRSAVAFAFAVAHGAALVALSRQLASARLHPLERVAAQVLFLQAVALAGLARYVRGDRPARWHKPER